jgi:hypothetical protein
VFLEAPRVDWRIPQNESGRARSSFWPGNRTSSTPIFYAYAYPTPEGFSEAGVEPPDAFWLGDLGEFALPYEAVRNAADPDRHLMTFLESTHAAAAGLAGWERSELECAAPRGPDWWRTRGSRKTENE